MKDFKEILEKIAKENGTTPENVLQEMQRAIDEAYDHHDASAQPLWDSHRYARPHSCHQYTQQCQ